MEKGLRFEVWSATPAAMTMRMMDATPAAKGDSAPGPACREDWPTCRATTASHLAPSAASCSAAAACAASAACRSRARASCARASPQHGQPPVKGRGGPDAARSADNREAGQLADAMVAVIRHDVVQAALAVHGYSTPNGVLNCASPPAPSSSVSWTLLGSASGLLTLSMTVPDRK